LHVAATFICGCADRLDPCRTACCGIAHGRDRSAGLSASGEADAGSDLIRKALFTSARVQDNEIAEALISGDEDAVYADRIYESKPRRAALKAQGIKARMMYAVN
jgi:hypothetical protein